MGKKYGGIPLPKFSYELTYFEDLLNITNNSPSVGAAKIALHTSALATANNIIPELQEQEKIKQATEFIKKVAINERNKELKVVQDYCQKMKIKLPKILSNSSFHNVFSGNPDPILNDPEEFYIQLTSYLNMAKHNAEDYKNTLLQIRRNAGLLEKEFQVTDRSEYSNQQAIYNLNNDITSLFKKLNGTFIGNQLSEDAFTTELQTWVLRIIQQSGIIDRITNGEDFATVAAMIITDLRVKLQKEYRKYINENGYNKTDKMDTIMRPELEKIAKQYLDTLTSQEEKEYTEVQEALQNLESPSYARLAQGVQSILGIEVLDIKNLCQQMAPKNSKRKINSKNKELVNNMLAEIHNTNLIEQMQGLTFTVYAKDNAHGNMSELVGQLISDKGEIVSKVRGNAGVDLLTAQIGWETSPLKNTVLHHTLQNMESIITSTVKQNAKRGPKELLNIKNNLHTMNEQIDNELKNIDEIIRNIDSSQQLFIFHESLKESTAIETGKAHSLHGRDLNILAAIDSILNGLESTGLSLPVDRELLVFLGLNLSKLAAVGTHLPEARNILADYFSIFAGMLMFDDIENMALETYNQIEYTNTNVIHVYKINNIFMPASMVLSYISNELQEGANIIMQRAAAKAYINVSAADRVINDWLENKWRHGANAEKSGYISQYYSMGEWPRVASKISATTRVRITFLGSFISFINKMF